MIWELRTAKSQERWQIHDLRFTFLVYVCAYPEVTDAQSKCIVLSRFIQRSHALGQKHGQHSNPDFTSPSKQHKES